MNKGTFPKPVSRTFSLGNTPKHRRSSAKEQPPNNPDDFEAFLTKELIRHDPAPLVRAIKGALREPPSLGRRVLYKRDKEPTWSVEESVGRVTQHQNRLDRWAAIHGGRQMANQFLFPAHECKAVRVAAAGVLNLCDAPDTRKYGLMPTQALLDDVLVLNMAYVCAHHEPTPTKPKRGPAPAGMAGGGTAPASPVVPKNKKPGVPVEGSLPTADPPAQRDELGERSRSMGKLLWKRSSLKTKPLLSRLPLSGGAPKGNADPSTPPGTVESPGRDRSEKGARHAASPQESQSARTSPTKRRFVTFKSTEDLPVPDAAVQGARLAAHGRGPGEGGEDH